MTEGKTWKTEDIDFDDEGRLVIKNEELSKAIDAQYARKKHLVIRMVPFEGQKRQPIEKLVPPEDLDSTPYGKALATELVPWGEAVQAGTDGSASSGSGSIFYSMMRRPPDPDPVQLGCGCDINLECP